MVNRYIVGQDGKISKKQDFSEVSRRFWNGVEGEWSGAAFFEISKKLFRRPVSQSGRPEPDQSHSLALLLSCGTAGEALTSARANCVGAPEPVEA